MANKGTIHEGDVVVFKLRGAEIVGRVYVVSDDGMLGIQDLWGTPYSKHYSRVAICERVVGKVNQMDYLPEVK